MFGKHENNTTAQHSEFLAELRGIVVQNLSEDDFGVSDLAKEVRLSRSQLHRKLKCLTGKSASCFIREIRLINASKLLRENNNTVSEIAYKVGFRSPTYFNKCFHDYFGHSPGVHKNFTDLKATPNENIQVQRKIKPCPSLYDKFAHYFGFIVIAIILVVVLIFLVFWLS
ncbi:AraC family transcriptional regulator [uncultured Draconibacterium sp.]|uniref:helix-turn-helix domain-containing protein n=1 Tax=uncultured Draconibacterium sp. TaxID=1573823 RepID=UPI002632A3F6|nr:helix-turn-helix transcriptional regulator [uncultured Draconibacterium sp.]